MLKLNNSKLGEGTINAETRWNRQRRKYRKKDDVKSTHELKLETRTRTPHKYMGYKKSGRKINTKIPTKK